jgi:hypothetical protein
LKHRGQSQLSEEVLAAVQLRRGDGGWVIGRRATNRSFAAQWQLHLQHILRHAQRMILTSWWVDRISLTQFAHGFFRSIHAKRLTLPFQSQANNVDAAAIAPYYTEVGNLFLFGGVITASRAEAMSVPTCARALGIIQTIASLPMHTRNEAQARRFRSHV